MTSPKKAKHKRILKILEEQDRLRKNASKGGKKRKTRKMKSKRKKRKTKRSRRRKSKTRRRRSPKKTRRRRRRRQRGGAVPGSGRLPYGQLTRQNFGQANKGVVPHTGQKGGTMLWRNLGFTWPKDTYNDTLTFLSNVKNTYSGDRPYSTSNVLEQPIANDTAPTMKPVDYLKHFNSADASTARNLRL